jgi:hypothetical protein
MGLRAVLRKLERDAREEMIVILQQDGKIKRFPMSAGKEAFKNAWERLGAGENAPPEHPLVVAARNSSDPGWSSSFYAANDENWTDPIKDLSE